MVSLDSKGASMVSQQQVNHVLTSSEPAILVYSRAAIVLQGRPNLTSMQLASGQYLASSQGHRIHSSQCH